MLASLAPVLFVFFWSTGFIVARAVTPHADAQFFLFCRFVAAATIWGALGCAARGHWPTFRRALQHVAVGAVMTGFYLCLSFWAVAHGLPAGVMALMGALQPLLTAALMVFRGKESPSASMWSGQAIGFVGVVLVLLPRINGVHVTASNLANYAGFAGVAAVTLGTLWQRQLKEEDLRVASSLQNIGASLIALFAVYAAGAVRWDASPEVWGLMFWSVVATSILGQGLLMWMLRRTSASHVTALLLLVPPVAALLAYALFHETLTRAQTVGFVMALTGVVLARRVRAG